MVRSSDVIFLDWEIEAKFQKKWLPWSRSHFNAKPELGTEPLDPIALSLLFALEGTKES